jgi:uncharacterized membrane protein
MPAAEIKEKRIHELFEVGILLKGLNALVEIVLGTLLLFTNVADIVLVMTQNELIDDPGDFIANQLQSFAAHLSPQAQTYAALYLLSHGIIKGFLVLGLLRDKLWAYPASLAVLSLFVLYQIIKYLENHSIVLVLLTLFDLVVMWLIYHEYRLKTRA